jgi:hypothetical protein
VDPCNLVTVGTPPVAGRPATRQPRYRKWRNGEREKKEVGEKLRVEEVMAAPELEAQGGRGGEGVHRLRRHPEDPVRLTPKGKRVGIASAWVCLVGCLSPKSSSMGLVGSAKPNARNGPAMLRVRVRGDR